MSIKSQYSASQAGYRVSVYNRSDSRVSPEKGEEQVTIDVMDAKLKQELFNAYRIKFKAIDVSNKPYTQFKEYCSKQRLPFHSSSIQAFLSTL